MYCNTCTENYQETSSVLFLKKKKKTQPQQISCEFFFAKLLKEG